MPDTLYDEDFFIWTERQAEMLRRAAREGSNLPLDFENLAEEIESLGKRDRREVGALVEAILIHLIKLACSPSEEPKRKWPRETDQLRFHLRQVLDDSPSLGARLADTIAKAHPRAMKEAEASLREYDELPAAGPLLAAWKRGSITTEDVLEEGAFPAHGSGELSKAE